MKRGSRFNFRRIYYYFCKGCKKKRGTKIYARREKGFCTICRRNKVDENQLSLLGGDGDEQKECLLAWCRLRGRVGLLYWLDFDYKGVVLLK